MSVFETYDRSGFLTECERWSGRVLRSTLKRMPGGEYRVTCPGLVGERRYDDLIVADTVARAVADGAEWNDAEAILGTTSKEEIA